MKRYILPSVSLNLIAIAIAIAIGIGACSNDALSTKQSADVFDINNGEKGKVVHHMDSTTVKPRPPVNLDYKILGTPEIGEPLTIEITVTSALDDIPVQVDYRAIDNQALRFMPNSGDGQSFKFNNLSAPGTRNIVVIPEQEGRNLITVTTQLQMPDGVVSFSQAIAIQVGQVQSEGVLNGVLKQDENGETVISMPAASQ